MAKTEEGKLSEQVDNYLTQKHVYHGRDQATSNSNGNSDWWFLRKGIYGRLELKAEKGKPTKLQLAKLQSINENGGIGVVVKKLDQVKILIAYIDDPFTYGTDEINHYDDFRAVCGDRYDN